MSKYIVWVREGNCIKQRNDWYKNSRYAYVPKEYHEYSSYGESYNMFNKIDLKKYHLSDDRKYLFKEVVVLEHNEDEEVTGWETIDYEERFFQDWIDG